MAEMTSKEMTPAQIGAYHADEAMEDYAARMAVVTEMGMAVVPATSHAPPVSLEDQEYLKAKVERFRKWRDTAARQKRFTP
jgi:hypothetical protein